MTLSAKPEEEYDEELEAIKALAKIGNPKTVRETLEELMGFIKREQLKQVLEFKSNCISDFGK